MSSTASIRDLRNHFPKIRKLLEAEGEVLLTESGTTKYRLTAFIAKSTKSPEPVDYWARLIRSQPEPISADAARKLHEENRGDR